MSCRLSITIIACTLAACGGVTTVTPEGGATSAKTHQGGIQGVVVDTATGTPVSFVTVIAQADGSKQTHSHTTDGNGTFTLRALPTGTYQVVATYGRHSTRLTFVPVKRADRTRLRIELDMRVAQLVTAPYRPTPAVPPPPQRGVADTTIGVIEGLVRNAKNNELLPGAVVGANSPVLAEPRLAVVNSQGRYRLPGLPPGMYVLSIYYTVVERGNVEFRRTGVAVTGGKATIIDLMLDTEKH